MVKFVFLLSLIFLTSNFDLRGQDNVLGVEIGRNFYTFEMADTGQGVFNLGLYSGRTTFGGVFTHFFKSKVFLESGLFYNRYIQQYKSLKYPIIHEEVYNAFVVPFKIGYSIDVEKLKLKLQPFVGYGQGIKTDPHTNDYYGIVFNFDQGGIYDSTNRGTFYYSGNRFFPLFNAGIRVGYQLSKNLNLGGTFEMYKGAAEIAKASFFYNKGSGSNDHYAEQTGKGSYFGWRLGIYYKISP